MPYMIGTEANQVPVNGLLGGMAFQNPDGFQILPLPSSAPTIAGGMCFQLTNNTTLVIKVKGSDGVVRSATIALT